ncbi:MAG: arginine--tRNA ligase [Candidatus Magasanikbacteria bacterium]|nr:arginine--tRNA ligase [Candidatus Magasanikbacteria bacterium]
MDIKSQLKKSLDLIIKEISGQDAIFVLEVPEDPVHGDYSTNAAMVLAKPLAKSPRAIAEQIKLEVEKQKWEVLDRVEIAGPGFVNFFISQNTLGKLLQEIEDKKDTFGNNSTLSGTKVITEFTDPNPFKEFHIGHLYSNGVGEAISRLIESQGAEVKRVCYQGDIGLHVAKALYGIMNNELGIKEIEDAPIDEKAKYLGKAYAFGATKYEEDELAKKEIIEINKKVFAKDPEVYEIYTQGKSWSLEYFETIYARLGTKFDNYFFESEVGEDGKKLVLGYLEKGVFRESEGAVIFPGEEYGLHNRVFINSLGLPTYEAKELGLAPAKYEYFPYDQSIVITGNEINAYFKVLLKALSLIRPELAEKTLHISHGMVRLPEGKMSSRTGKILTGEWLLDEAKKRVIEKMNESDPEISDAETIAEKIAVAAVKYALLKSGIGGDIAFSFDESISFEGNSGPYLQYTYVRTQGILGKSNSLTVNKWKMEDGKWKMEIEEEALLRHLIHFPEIVSYAAATHSPNHVCEYLYQLAQKFNLFYAKHKIVGSDREPLRLVLTQSVGQVLQNGLTLLGIPVVEKM